MTTPEATRALADAHAHYQAGRLRDAFNACRGILAATPENAAALHLFGVILHESGYHAEASAYIERSLRIDPADAAAWSNLAVVFDKLGRVDEAIRARSQAAGRAPADPAIASNLAAALLESGQAAAAESAARRATTIEPSYAGGWFNLALALEAQARWPDALAAATRALTLAPDDIGAAGTAAQLAARSDDLPLARRILDDALRRRPRAAPLQLVLAWVATRQDDLPAAAAAFEAVLADDPDHGAALSQLIFIKKRMADWNGLPALQQRFRDGVQRGAQWLTPFSFLSDPSTPAEQRRCATVWSAGYVPTTSSMAVPPPPPPRAEGRLRIGYLSGDFYEHPTAVLATGVFERHDREAFEVFAYSTGPDDGSAMRARCVAAFEHFVDVRDAAPGQLAARIRQDGIDILVDLKGHTEGAPTAALGVRPAPVQAHWLGYPGTLGAPFVDYLIGDAVVTPAEHATDYSETLVRLPGCYQPNDRSRIAGETPPRAELGLPDRAVVLCGFNATWKLNAGVLDAWARILGDVPDAVLWLSARSERDPAIGNLRREAGERGIDPARLVFATHRPPPQYLALFRHADLFVDSWPYGAHTTASDALWMGTPVISWLGPGFAGRVASSALTAAGISELIAADVDGYVTLVTALARDTERRHALRGRVAESARASLLFDAARTTRALERAFVAMADQSRRGARVAIDA